MLLSIISSKFIIFLRVVKWFKHNWITSLLHGFTHKGCISIYIRTVFMRGRCLFMLLFFRLLMICYHYWCVKVLLILWVSMLLFFSLFIVITFDSCCNIVWIMNFLVKLVSSFPGFSHWLSPFNKRIFYLWIVDFVIFFTSFYYFLQYLIFIFLSFSQFVFPLDILFLNVFSILLFKFFYSLLGLFLFNKFLLHYSFLS